MTRSPDEPLPRTFVLELTRSCNHRCVHCYTVWDPPELDYGRYNGKPLTTTGWKKLIRQLHEDVPTLENIAISGGEPLLFDDLSEIVKYIIGRGISVVVITNGSLLTEPRLEELLAAGAYFEVPLLSHRPEIHDELTGRPGSWATVVDNLANMIGLEGGWVCVFVATRKNHMDLPETAKLAMALGAEGLMYNRVNLGAGNKSLARELLPTPTMIRKNLKTVEQLKVEFGLQTAVSVVIEPCVVDPADFPNVRFGWCPLAGENSYFTVDPCGYIRICNHSPEVLGNLKEVSFLEIYRKHPYVKRFREELPVECRDCPAEWRDLCNGGCKAAGEQCRGSPAKVDPFVTRYRKKKKKTQGPV